MKKLSKILYSANSFTCIFIGILHTFAHYSDLITPEAQRLLNHNIVVTGIETSIWKLWQGMSLMMGFLLIIIGILHLSIIRRTSKKAYPPVSGSVIMICMLVGVIYIGANFFSLWQVIGGSVGIVLQTICLVLSIRNK